MTTMGRGVFYQVKMRLNSKLLDSPVQFNTETERIQGKNCFLGSSSFFLIYLTCDVCLNKLSESSLCACVRVLSFKQQILMLPALSEKEIH